MSIEARRIGASDLGALERFFALCADDSAVRSYFNPHPLDAAMARRIAQREGVTRDEYFGVFDGGEIVGYGMLRGWDEGYEIPSFGVCVRPGERGRGVGRQVLALAIDIARENGAPSIMLKVHEGNERARALYTSFGFTFTERTPDGAQLIGRLALGERDA